MRIAVIGGTGYVGLTTAVCLASKGHYVFCVGRNEEKVAKIRSGIPIIYEEGLQEMLQNVLSEDKFVSTTNIDEAVQGSDVSFICVGTPSKEDGSIDLTQIKIASEKIGKALAGKEGYHVVTVRSTVVPGTTEEVVLPSLESFSGKKVGKDFGLCMNPEFLREGNAIKDLLYPKDLGIVIGELDRKSGDTLFEIYREFDAGILRTSIRTAEMIKYARNAYLAKDISFANEIANICQKLRVDYSDVKRAMEMDGRIGKGRFLNAGAGFGGSCFPKDVKALIAKARSIGILPKILEATIAVNDSQPYEAIRMLEDLIGEVKGRNIAILGLAFKRDTDDMREAPSIKIINKLLSKEANIFAYDPKAIENARKIFGSTISFKRTAEEALREADACVIVTDWEEFANPNLYNSMKGRVIIDGRRILDSSKLEDDFEYYAVGSPKTKLA